jgi:phenylacetate-CoA ligase
MKDRVLEIYQRMPAPLRSLVASLRGLQLRAWRYGRETERLVQQALERDHWSPEEWRDWKAQRLHLILQRAATQVPYYREQWAERRRQGDQSSWEELDNWPILEKDSLRQNARAFVADDCNPRRLFYSHTSGTTGKPLDLWYSKETARLWYALFEARCRHWFELSRHQRWAILGGQLITSVQQRRPPFWVWNAALNQLYMSSYHLAADLIPHYLDALQRYRIEYLYGYTSSLFEVAQQALALGRDDLRMKVVLTNAEPVFDYQREVIEKAFHCKLRQTYGMAEMAAGASECEKGSMHIWSEVSELQIAGAATTGNLSGELISTGLLNADMPLIRYRIGDQVSLAGNDTRCSCGRTLPLMGAIEGRSDDMLYTTDGRCIGRLDPVFKAQLPIHEAQIIQEALDTIRVRYVPAPGFDSAAERSITERLRARLGNVRVILEEMEKLPRGVNGKFRAVICNLPAKERLQRAGMAPSGS